MMKSGFKQYAIAAAIIWTVAIILSLIWNIFKIKQEIIEIARIQAQVAFEKDITYRRWAAWHGGVYVPVTDETPPNPYLNVEERDIATPSGKALTLMNPAYMTRQVQKLANEWYGAYGGIISLTPINPINKPDPWEEIALKSIQFQGKSEVTSIERISNVEFMRLIRPLMTDASCLKCHETQGYKLGEIRGGISVAVPMKPLRAIEARNIRTIFLVHLLLWFIGIIWHSIGSRHMLRTEAEIRRASEEWENTFNAIPDFIAILDRDQRITRCNRPMADGLGYTLQDIIGNNCFFCFHGTDEPPSFCPYIKMLEDGQVHSDELYIDKLGKTFFVTTSPLHDEQDQINGCVHVARDITDMKRIEALLQGVLDSSLSGIMVFRSVRDREGRIVDFEWLLTNPTAAKIIGHSHEYLNGRKLLEEMPGNKTEGLFDQYVQVTETGQSIQFEKYYKHESVESWFLISVVKYHDGFVVTFDSITERKQAEAALKESEKRLREAHRIAHLGLWELDLVQDTFYCSDEIYTIFNISPQNAFNSYDMLMESVHPEDQDYVSKAYAQAITEKISYEIVYRLLLKNGTVKHVQAICRTEFDEEGAPFRSVGTILDITELKKIEAAFRESESKFRLAFENAQDAILWADAETGILVNCNQAAANLFETSIDELIGQSFKTLHPPEKADFYEQVFINHGYKKSESVEAEVVTKSGQIRIAAIKSSMTRVQGKTVIQGIFRDITERKRAEEEIAKFKAIFDNANFGAAIADKMGKISYINRFFAEIHGYDANELIGKNLSLFHTEKQLKDVIEINRKLLKTGEFSALEIWHKHKDGSIFPMLMNGIVIKDHAGNPMFIAATAIDITDRKKAECELKAALKAAQAATIAKSQFLANMSHEIRTPLNAVIGMSGILLDTDLTEKQKEYADIVKFNGEQLLTLINDILDFSKIESGKLELEMLDFDLHATLKNLTESLAFKAHEKGLELICMIEPDVPFRLRGDPGRLCQILTNLGTNAIKFTKIGEVAIRVQCMAEDQRSATFRFEVNDSGIGIPENQLSNLFNPFEQVDASTTRKYGGTGLGLAISKMLAEMMGGKIGVESELGKGSTFWFTAMLEKQRPESTVENTESDRFLSAPLSMSGDQNEFNPRKYRILIVEDNIFNQKVAVAILDKLGYYTDTVANGIEAIQSLETTPYDIVLMDCQMPEMDGYEATQAIRSKNFQVLNRDIPIIAMTANAMKGDREKCIAFGMNDYISKPIREKKLADVLKNWLVKTNDSISQAALNQEDELEPIFDRDGFMERVGGDEELFQTLIDMFLNEMPKQLAALKNFLRNGDIASATAQAHSIKGMTANAGGNRLSSVALEMEKAGKAGDQKTIEMLLPKMEKEFHLLKLEMDNRSG